MLTLSSHAEFLTAVARASDITCEAYVLSRPLADALAAAAARGAHVRVRLEGAPLGSGDSKLAEANRHRVTELRAQGVDASLADGRDGIIHAKVALMDGVAWLDDRNFPNRPPDLIVRDDDPADTAAIADALAGLAAGEGRVALDKTSALELEARALVADTPPTLDVSTESFGYGPIERVLRDAVARGAHVRLIVSARELRAGSSQEAAALALVGADVRVRQDVDKLAVTPTCAWVGSANATALLASDPQREWGVMTDRSAAVAELQARFEADWQGARPYAAATTLIA